MKRILSGLLLAMLVIVWMPGAVQAQSADPLDEGRQAFREGRYEDAARLFERVAENDPANAEAHYLLARVYFETPLEDQRKARRELERALELEPNNVKYLVGRLQQLRTETWNFFSEKIKEARRMELARDILKLDPDNAFAHEELGTVYIRDFWRYRNAIMLPSLQYNTPSGYERSSSVTRSTPVGVSDGELVEEGDFSMQELDDALGSFDAISPDQVFMADQFDVEALRSQGVPIADFSVRAERAYQRAVAHLQKALEVDPRRRSVYDEMMQIFALKGEYEDALAMLEQMYQFFPEDPELWTYLGMTHHKLGNLEAADKSFATAFNYMDEEALQAYQDLTYILPDDEKKKYEEDPVAYASRFWTSKDPRYLTRYNERKLEHFSRLTYADLLYGSEALNLRGWNTERGHILVRYGPPRADVVIVPQEDGLYSARDKLAGAIFYTTFGASEDDPAVTEGTLNTTGTQSFDTIFSTARQSFEEMNTYNIWEYGPFRFVFEDPFRNGEYRMYSPPAEQIASSVVSWQNDYVIKSKETFRKYPEQYDYEAPGRQIELPYLVTAFKGTDGKADLYVNYGVPIAGDLDPSKDMIEITANTGTFLISDQRDILVERRKTIYGLPAEQVLTFQDQKLWLNSLVMEAPPGEHEVSVEFETASGSTVAVQRRNVDVPDFSTDRLAVSDVMLAYRIEETFDGNAAGAGEIVRNDFSILPAPWSVFNADSPIYIYFETYNLELNESGQTDYEVEIALVPKDEAKGIAKLFKGLLGRKKGVALSYPGSGNRPDEPNYQIIDASEQESGFYTIILQVTDNVSGRSAETRQDLFLEK